MLPGAGALRRGRAIHRGTPPRRHLRSHPGRRGPGDRRDGLHLRARGPPDAWTPLWTPPGPAFPAGPGPLRVSVRALHRFAAVLAERAEDFARAESLQCGKPLKLTREFDVPGTIDNTAFFAGAARHLQGSRPGNTPATTPPSSAANPSASSAPSRRGTTRSRWPPGRSPAIAAGNTIVLKPAEMTPLTSLLFAEAAHRRRDPDGVSTSSPGRPGKPVSASSAIPLSR